MSRKAYFKNVADGPAPLRVTCERTVRFEDVDPLGIVWHGYYPSYFEDGRVALGDKYGIGYLDMKQHGVVAPIKQMQIDYHKPLMYGDTATIEAILHFTEAARLNYEFIIRDKAGDITTTGCTIQLFVDAHEDVMMYPPVFYADFLARWKTGKL